MTDEPDLTALADAAMAEIRADRGAVQNVWEFPDAHYIDISWDESAQVKFIHACTPERIRALKSDRDRWRTFALMAGVTELDNGNVIIPDDEGMTRTRRWWWPW